MKAKEFFKEGKNNIGWVGTNFQDTFWDMNFEIPKKLELKTKVLERYMNDKEILAEFEPEESNLGELAYALKNDVLSKNGYVNIFYIRDKNNTLWAVCARWYSDLRYWSVGANPLGGPYRWNDGYQVLSRDWNFSKSDTSDTLTLGDSDTVEIMEIKYKGKVYRLID